MIIESPVESSQQNLLQFFELISESQKGPVVGLEKRNNVRVDYPHPVFLTPIGDNGEPDLEETFGVLGRQISQNGFDFYHKEPIAHKIVIVSFEYSPDRWLGAKMKLNWCRFGRHGYFENGGEFLEIVESPFGIGVID